MCHKRAFRFSDDTTVADILYETVRILCLVMTYPENHQKRAIHVNATWGQRCTKLLFVTSTTDQNLPTLIVNVTDGRDHLAVKTRDAFDHAYENYLADYDWFLKADDDTYVIMENLRYFLSAQDHNLPVVFGQTFTQYMQQGYPSGGAGYVTSREALRRYGQRNNGTEGCKFDSDAEDVAFGQCMESLGVRLGDSLDALGRTRFHCLPPTDHISGEYPDWYYTFDKQNGTKKVRTIPFYKSLLTYPRAALPHMCLCFTARARMSLFLIILSDTTARNFTIGCYVAGMLLCLIFKRRTLLIFRSLKLRPISIYIGLQFTSLMSFQFALYTVSQKTAHTVSVRTSSKFYQF